MQDIPYREVLGSLLFLATRTHPDLAMEFSMLGRHQQEPMVKHLTSINSVVRYRIFTLDYGDMLSSSQEALLEAWSDMDCARDHHKLIPRSVQLITVAGGPLVWCSRLQSLTAQATSE